jgi:hypothetical protein
LTNLEDEIRALRSKQQVMRLVRWVGKNKTRIRQLMESFLQEDPFLSKKSAWVAGHCAEAHPELFGSWLKPMIKKMQDRGAEGAVKRNIVRILQFVDIPKSLQGMVANQCFQFLAGFDEPIAVRTFSITVLARIAEKEPVLRKELELAVRQMLPYSTPAFRARAKMILGIGYTDQFLETDKELDAWLYRGH